MNEIAIIPSYIIDDIKNTQELILKKLDQKEKSTVDEKYISRQTAAVMFDCTDQLISKLENEKRISRFGRGRFIRYSVSELKQALGIISE